MIDTHTHLYMPAYEGLQGSRQAVERAFEAGVDKLIFPNVDVSSVGPMLELSKEYPEKIFCALGLHPTEVKEDWATVLNEIFSEEKKFDNLVAIGEVGIDLYWDKTFLKQQMEAFEKQCVMATERRLPIIIHCREGLDETLEVLRDFPEIKGVFHSFGGTEEDVERIRKCGDFYFGINGIVTFKNSKLRNVLPAIGVERIILETDAPYLAPVPMRGKRNESAYLPYVCEHIAESLNFPADELEKITNKNASNLFGLPV